ncbi:MAG: thiamine diphosphokinase [Pleurocapsa minor GSE-CHR-MK-17-07R]|nr:thiamine diphosphokinase [Pleurocapsa minor GSE-CHR-MK 17-07R]
MTDPLHSPAPLALVFANGDFNDGPMVRRVLDHLPGDYRVIAADGGARHALALGMHIDAVVGDMDSIAPEVLVSLEINGAEIHRYSREKDETDLELALAVAASEEAGRIVVIGAIGSRLDQTLSNVYLLALPALAGIPVRLVSGNQRAWLLQPGTHIIHGEAGDTVSLLPLGGDAGDIHTDGLYYPLRGETLRFGPARGVSNVMLADTATVRLATGMLMVVHTAGEA